MQPAAIATERLDLVPASIRTLDAALASADTLADSLAAIVPASWPPQFLDDAALRFTRARLAENPVEDGWWMYWVILRAPRPTLVGTAGYKGPPSGSSVEIGYGIVSDHQRRGYATEVALALVARAFEHPEVDCVLAETLPELEASIGVLRKCGFRLLGEGSEPGVIRFELARSSGRPGDADRLNDNAV